MYKKIENFHNALLGENVFIFSDKDDPVAVNSILKEIYEKQEAAQFGTERYSLYFLPGSYDASIEVNIGFYMQAAGLGILPTDTTLPSLQCTARWLGDEDNHKALCNVWRGVENLHLTGETMWAVSQATFMRRMKIDKTLYLHDEQGWASGGFLADSVVEDIIDSGSQQQWLNRNNRYKGWKDEHWNQVFVGDAKGCAPTETWTEKAFTVVDTTPVVREKPFLIYDENIGFAVYVPDLRKECAGESWSDERRGKVISLADFHVANPATDTAKTLSDAVSLGKHLFFTPGIYKIEEPIRIERADTIVLGTGLATLIPTNGNACMEAADADGIIISGLLFDAGSKNSSSLLVVGREKNNVNHAHNPICLSDLFFRVGGASTELPTMADVCLTIYSNDVVCDHFWLWRADHGAHVGWDKNIAKNGIIVYGDRVVLYALMVEHYMEYQTLFYGEGARLYMYQCEIPYDVPCQEVWMSRNGTRRGYASIYVDDNVERFQAYGLGVYLVNKDAPVILESAMEVPAKENIEIHNICTVMLTPKPGIAHIINEEGDGVMEHLKRAVLCEYRGRMVR